MRGTRKQGRHVWVVKRDETDNGRHVWRRRGESRYWDCIVQGCGDFFMDLRSEVLATPPEGERETQCPRKLRETERRQKRLRRERLSDLLRMASWLARDRDDEQMFMELQRRARLEDKAARKPQHPKKTKESGER